MARRPLLIVLNARAGKGEAAAAWEMIRAALQEAGRPFDVVELTRGSTARDLQRAAALARQRRAALVAIGGDGTISSVAREALAADLPLGVVPRGTFNYFAREWGIPDEPMAAAEVLLHGEERRVQVGLVNGLPFLVNASLGLYPRLLEDREAFLQQTRRSRVLAVLSSLVLALRGWRQLRIEAEQGSGVVRTPTLFVGNTRVQMERLGLAPQLLDCLSEGRLIGLRLSPISTWALLSVILRGALGQLGGTEHVEQFGFRRLVVHPRGRRSLRVAMDGEVTRLRTPLTIEVRDAALSLLVPRAPLDRPT